MPHKKSKSRKAGSDSLSATRNRRAGRPDPLGAAQKRPPAQGMRDRRFDRRPPKFPGRLGGR